MIYDEEIYEAQQRDYRESIKYFHSIYRKNINENLVAMVGQQIHGGSQDQFLTLVLRDTKNNRFIIMRLKTFRRLIKWMFGKGFTEKPRRLSIKEKLFREPTPDELREKLKNNKKEVRLARARAKVDGLSRLVNNKSSSLNAAQRKLDKAREELAKAEE